MNLTGFDKVQSSLAATQNKLRDNAQAAKRTSQEWEELSQTLRRTGLAFTALAAGGTLALGSAIKAAAAEADATARMAQTLENAGVAFDGVREETEKFFAAQQRLTAFNDTDLQDTFTEILGITQDYGKSLELTSVAADLARAKNIDLKTSAQLVGRAFVGQTSMLTRYGIILAEGTTGVGAINEITRRFGGTAQSTATVGQNAFNRLGDAFSDVKEAIGAELLPIAERLSAGMVKLADIFLSLGSGIKKTIAFVAVAATAFTGVVGVGLLLAGSVVAIKAAFAALAVVVGGVVVPIAILAAKLILVTGILGGVIVGLGDDRADELQVNIRGRFLVHPAHIHRNAHERGLFLLIGLEHALRPAIKHPVGECLTSTLS